MSAFELPVLQDSSGASSPTPAPPVRSEAWLRAARQAKLLAWASLAWMSVEGFVGVLAGVQAHSLGVVTWAASSFVEALASLIVVWRFTGHRRLSATSEARAQKWVAASFFLLAPYFVVEAIRKLIDGGHTDTTVLAVGLTASAIVLMPLLGWAKLRLGRTLDSGATAGEGIQNIMCAVQAGTALVALAGAGIGLGFLDPIAALVIAGIALKEGRDGWRGEDTCCTPMPGLDAPSQAPSCKGDVVGVILVAGSGTLVRTLLEADLVDELRLMVFPTILGRGRRLFPDGIDRLRFKLAESRTVGSDGVQVQIYGRAE